MMKNDTNFVSELYHIPLDIEISGYLEALVCWPRSANPRTTNLVLTLLNKTLIVSEGQIFNRPHTKAMVFLKLTVKHYALKI